MRRSRRRLWEVLAAAGVVSTSAFMMGDGIPRSETLRAEWPECPHSFDTIRVSKSSRKTTLATETFVFGPGGMSVPKHLTNVPEFHDCQRIILSNGNKYGPLMAVFAAADLGQRKFSNRDTSARRDTSLVGDSSAFRDVYAAVEVFNDSADFTYEPLGIGPLFNCLYVYRVAGQLRAKMRQVGAVEKDCAEPVDPIAIPGTDLAVDETLKDYYDEADYPSVARWDWDKRHREQYIGLKCGRAWCEVGRLAPFRFYPSNAYLPPPPAGTIAPEDRVRAIKGWYDQQYVAVQAGINVKPGNVVATFFPDPDLAAHANDGDFHRTWITVSYAAFEGPPGQYKHKFNFDDRSPAPLPLSRMNPLALCYGTAGQCSVPLFPLPSASLVTSCGPSALMQSIYDERWWARLRGRTSSGGTVNMFKCVNKRDHAGVPIAATVRWRWLAEDETEWQYCPNGCCEVQAKAYD